MLQKIRVQTAGRDGKAEDILSDIKQMLKLSGVQKVETVKVYRLEGIGEKQANLLAENLLHERINQRYTLNKEFPTNKATVIEIAYKPGVMNPEVASIRKAAGDLGINLKAVDASWEYIFHGVADRTIGEEIALKIRLYNPLIEHVVVEEPKTLLIEGAVGKTVVIQIRKMSDDALLAVSKDKLFLNLEEMKVIQRYFQKIKRDPTDLELETLAQTWSEHCAHKTFKAKLIVDGKEKEPLMSRIKKEALKYNKHIVSAFVDNSGVMDFYNGYAINGKAETHNSPSAIEPYGGAMTGSGGVFRDVVATGQGAKAIVSTDIFCFAPPNMDLNKLPKGSLPPDYLLKRCVHAVRDYGNRIGIPTNNGSFHFHDDFRAKPTVLVGSYGIIPKKFAQKGKPKVGDLAIAIGGRTGRDGIHGATFSSAEMTDRTISVNATAVQIGNAIEEKRVFDAILEARDKLCIRAMQDCGAGGFSSAFGEMGEKTGITIDLKNAELKYPGLSPWEIWVSESQERMALAIPKSKVKQFLAICKKYNVETSVLGYFDGTKRLNVFYGKKRVSDLSMNFLHHGLPQRTMRGIRPHTPKHPNTPKHPTLPKSEKEWVTTIQNVLSHANICSKEPIVRMYDHSVQGTNDLQPYSGVNGDGPNDAVVLRPFLDKQYGLVVSHGLNPILNKIDPYWGSIWAAAEAIANYTAVGGNYKDTSLINNYIWPFPDEESLWTLDQSVSAVVDFMKALKIPVISGKDSLSSTYRSSTGEVIKIPPVLCISVFGKIPNASKTATSDFKKKGSTIVLAGELDVNAMAGSVYFDVLDKLEPYPSSEAHAESRSNIPKINLKQLPKVLAAVQKGISQGKILSAHDISEGGLITSLFEMCLGGNIGAKINLPRITSDGDRLSLRNHGSSEVDVRPDFLLFNETAGTFLVEVENSAIANKLFKNVPHAVLGKTQDKFSIEVKDKNTNLFTANIELLRRVWKEPMKHYF